MLEYDKIDVCWCWQKELMLAKSIAQASVLFAITGIFSR